MSKEKAVLTMGKQKTHLEKKSLKKMETKKVILSRVKKKIYTLV